MKALFASANCDAEDIARLLADLHNALFFLDSRYFEFINRLLRIEYVSVFPAPEKDFNYKFVGYLILFGMAVKLAGFWASFRRHCRSDGEEAGEVRREAAGGVDCKVCFEERRESAATLCGHVFCWQCILKVSQMRGECPVCRAKVHPKDVIRLFNSQ